MSTLQEIETAIRELRPEEQRELAERLMQQLRQRRPKAPPGTIKAADFYGSGKHIWGDEDAQEYVNRLREDRECP
ncbi:MAG: hypothetical protein FJ291_11180 [Planctomycetes bacterium]|nr:hypothetical protein [Planctomycetota bacterium]